MSESDKKKIEARFAMVEGELKALQSALKSSGAAMIGETFQAAETVVELGRKQLHQYPIK